MWATARPKREGRKMRERPEPACSVPDLAHLQQAFLRRKVARLPGVHIGDAVHRTPEASPPFRAPEGVPSEGSQHPCRETSEWRPLVVFEMQLQDATQPSFIQDDDVVQALAANRTDQALDIGILPRRSRSREDCRECPASLSLREIPFRSTRRDREADSEAHCPKGELPAVGIAVRKYRNALDHGSQRTWQIAARRLQCCTAIAFGPRFWLLAPGNSAKGLPAISASEPPVGSIENTSIWLSTLSSTYRKLSGPSSARATARPFVKDSPISVSAAELASTRKQSTSVPFATCRRLPSASMTGDWIA